MLLANGQGKAHGLQCPRYGIWLSTHEGCYLFGQTVLYVIPCFLVLSLGTVLFPHDIAISSHLHKKSFKILFVFCFPRHLHSCVHICSCICIRAGHEGWFHGKGYEHLLVSLKPHSVNLSFLLPFILQFSKPGDFGAT